MRQLLTQSVLTQMMQRQRQHLNTSRQRHLQAIAEHVLKNLHPIKGVSAWKTMLVMSPRPFQMDAITVVRKPRSSAKVVVKRVMMFPVMKRFWDLE